MRRGIGMAGSLRLIGMHVVISNQPSLDSSMEDQTRKSDSGGEMWYPSGWKSKPVAQARPFPRLIFFSLNF
jgi:hypothetical protein